MAAKRRPKLGQHFLSSDTYRRRIAEALSVQPDDLVIEIGPGRGAMTGLLAGRASRVVAVELDSALAQRLGREFTAMGSVEVIAADILQVDIGEICRRHNVLRAFVFGNLPYYITSPILHHLLQFPHHIRSLACVVQFEVAERITAQPGNRAYGYLSVLSQLHSAPRLCFRIPPGAFSPPPAVFSALVTFEMLPEPAVRDDGRRRAFLEFAKHSFTQKRKTLANNLGVEYGVERVRNALRALGLTNNARAEELGVAELVRLLDDLDPHRP